jgi:hypothetical protein
MHNPTIKIINASLAYSINKYTNIKKEITNLQRKHVSVAKIVTSILIFGIVRKSPEDG